MKVYYNLATFLLILNVGWSQENIEKRITEVENGLTLQKTVPADQKVIQASILNRLKEYKINGVSVAVVHDGKIDWSKAYGIADIQTGDSVTTETLFQSASIGKLISALAVLRLVKEGKLGLDENVNNKLKRWKIAENQYTADKKVTLRYLLSHSSGLTDEYGFLGYSPHERIPNLLQIINHESPSNAKKSLEIKAKPGEIERYSGGGYLIIQLLIEDITGYGFSDYVNKVIFQPLDMINSTYNFWPDKNPKVKIASGHLNSGKPLRNKRYHIYPELGAAGPWTTAIDLAKVIIEIQKEYHEESELILNKELISEFLNPQINNKGLGVNLKGLNKPEAFWHAGQNLGYTGLLYGLIDQKDGAVILINSDGGSKFMQEFMTSVAQAYEWPVMKSAYFLEIPAQLKVKLIGKYQDVKSGKTLYVETIKGDLTVRQSNAKMRYHLYRLGDTEYTFKDAQDYYRVTFNLEDDYVKGMVYTQSIGNIIILKKIE
jgi:CubicO group peptidase (beta-lactamase class C family)